MGMGYYDRSPEYESKWRWSSIGSEEIQNCSRLSSELSRFMNLITPTIYMF